MWQEVSIRIVRHRDNPHLALVMMTVQVDDKTHNRSFEIPVSNAGVYINEADNLIMNFTVDVEEL